MFMYSNHYPVYENTVTPHGICLRKLLRARPVSPDFAACEMKKSPSIHATFYGLGDEYVCISLKKTCQQEYVEELNRAFSISNFISSINIVYENTPRLIMGCASGQFGAHRIIQIFYSFIPTSRPYSSREGILAGISPTEYARANRFWCKACIRAVPSYTCPCANSGICEGSDYCVDGTMENLSRPECEVIGMLYDGPLHQFLTARGSCLKALQPMKRRKA